MECTLQAFCTFLHFKDCHWFNPCTAQVPCWLPTSRWCCCEEAWRCARTNIVERVLMGMSNHRKRHCICAFLHWCIQLSVYRVCVSAAILLLAEWGN